MQIAFSRNLFNSVFSIIVASSLVACNKSAKDMQSIQAISATNKDRERFGLRTIKPSWYLYRSEFGAEDWKISQSSRELAKRVQYDGEQKKIQWEEDYYYSGCTYTDADGTGWEHVVIHYDYLTRIYTLHYLGNKSALHVLVEPFRAGTRNRSAMANAADMILKDLGQSRL